MNIKGAMRFWKNAACHVTAQKSTFFSSQKNWGNFCPWADDSYVEKSEKNIGAKIFTLSIAVLPEIAIQVLVFSYISLLTQLPPFETSNTLRIKSCPILIWEKRYRFPTP